LKNKVEDVIFDKKNSIFAAFLNHLIKEIINNYKSTYIIHQNQKKMKKIFTMFFALLAFAFSAKAQVVFSENFDSGMPTGWTQIDANNDNYGWEHSSNPASYFDGADLTGTGHNSSAGFVLSGSYSNVTSQAITPDNWLITPTITLTANSTLTYWVCGQDASYAAEHYGVYVTTGSGTTTSEFTLLYQETIDANGGAKVQGAWKQKSINLSSYTGQTIRIAFRHFNCNDQFVLNLDDVEVFAQPTNPTITVNPTSVDFGSTAVGISKNASVDITTYNLTAAVTATTTAPFSVSADGTTYGTTASVAATGGTLYLQYTPTATGTSNGTVTLASTGATDVTVTLTGSAIECSTTLPYSYSFENDGANLCWTVINNNNDNYTFTLNSADSLAEYHWNSSASADDWLISPAFTLTGAQFCYFDYYASSYYPEKFQVFAIDVNNNNTPLTGIITANSGTYETQVVDLTSLTGNYRIGIHCVSDPDQFYFRVKNFNVSNNPPAANMTVSETALDFSTIALGSTTTPKTVVISTLNVNEAITLTTAAPFEVSLDGTSFAATQTIPANASMVVNDTVYVRFAPTAVGTFNQNLTISITGQNATVALTGAAADCSGNISTFPFLYDFNTGIYPPICWGYNNADNYDRATVDANAGDYALYVSGIDMLVTPEINSNNPMAVMFGYRNYLGSNYDDNHTSFRVGYSTTNDNASSFTWMTPVTIDDYPEGDELFATYSANIPANTKYVAIDFTAFGSYYDGYYEDVVYIDNFRLLTDATMLVSPESISFGSIIFGASPVVKTANVTTALLTSDINVTAPANFEVSANGASYAATATLPQAGGTLHVRYNPTSTGSHNGTITLTSGSFTKTITVSGSAIDCSGAQSLPFVENFDNGMPNCWMILDEDGDGYSWETSDAPESYFSSSVDLSGSGHNESYGYIMSGSYSNVNGVLNPDNWLITPALSIPSEGATLSFYVAAQDANYAAEHYGVYVSTSGTAPANFTLLYEEDLDADGGPRAQGTWKQKTVNLANYAGQTIHIAVRHFNCTDMFLLNLDDFTVTAGVGVENFDIDNTVSVYPNPATNVLNINANSNINRVEVYNMMGQMVGMYEANDVNTQINTTAFANGVYTVKIATENGTTTKKFTVAR
jgi:hypothetical protein